MASKRNLFFLYRSSPFRPLYSGGLGFQPPPSRTWLSSLAKKERKRWTIWQFTDRNLAYALAKSCNKTAPGVSVARMSDFVQAQRTVAPSTQPRHTKRKVPLDDLA